MLSRLLKHLAIAGVCLTAALPAVQAAALDPDGYPIPDVYVEPGYSLVEKMTTPNCGTRIGDLYYEFTVGSNQEILWSKRGDVGAPWNNLDYWSVITGSQTIRYPSASAITSGSTTRCWIAHVNTNGKLQMIYSDTMQTSNPQYVYLPEFSDALYSCPAMGIVGGRTYLFWVGARNGSMKFKFCNNGSTTWSSTYDAGGTWTSAPTVARVGSQLFVYGRNSDKVVVKRVLKSDYTWATTQWYSHSERAHYKPSNQRDPAIVQLFGGHVNGADECGSWAVGKYHQKVMSVMGAKAIKFVMDTDWMWADYYNPNGTVKNNQAYPWELRVPWDEIKTAISYGAKVIILRTTDTFFDANYIREFMGTSVGGRFRKFKSVGSIAGQTKTIWNLINESPGVYFVIEVGNEPNSFEYHTGISDIGYRDRLISAGQVLGEYSHSRLTWAASMPVYNSDKDITFIRTALNPQPGTNFRVQTYYQALGVHAYGTTKVPNPNDPEQQKLKGMVLKNPAMPWRALHYAQSRLDLGKYIILSEMGVNTQNDGTPWFDLGNYCRNFVSEVPASVAYSNFFCQDRYSFFNNWDPVSRIYFTYCIDLPIGVQGTASCNGYPYYKDDQLPTLDKDYYFSSRFNSLRF